MRKLKQYYQIIEIDKPGHQTVVAGGKSKKIAEEAMRMLPGYENRHVEWMNSFIPHNMTNTEVTQGIVR